MTSHVERVALFRKLLVMTTPLLPETLDMTDFRTNCFKGIPDEPGIRATCWKVLLGYLPPEKHLWEDRLYERRTNYLDLIKEVFSAGFTSTNRQNDDVLLSQIRRDARRTLPTISLFQSPVRENPFSPIDVSRQLSPSSSIVNFFVDQPAVADDDEEECLSSPIYDREHNYMEDLLSPTTYCNNDSQPSLSINDCSSQVFSFSTTVASTPLEISPELLDIPLAFMDPYSTTQAPKTAKNVPSQKKGGNFSSKFKGEPIKTSLEPEYRSDMHWEVVERILYVYAKLNPLVGYVQGMNCLIGPIYWLFASDPDPINQAHAEADTFFCFSALMSEARDYFQNSMDLDNHNGIQASLSLFEGAIEQYDPLLSKTLKEQGLAPQYFAFRWYTCLCAAEWPLPDLLRIWDSLLSDPSRSNRFTGIPFLTDLCCSMLISVREQLIHGNFDSNLKLLQAYPAEMFEVVLKKAYEIWEQRRLQQEKATKSWMVLFLFFLTS